WDRALPLRLIRLLAPLARAGEIVAQRLGRGWWGPSQFLMAQRFPVRQAIIREVPPGIPALAARMCCAVCKGRLAWSPGIATCLSCGIAYHWDGAVWNFTVPADGD